MREIIKDVIPVKTGQEPRKLGISWIPAFAGMTETESVFFSDLHMQFQHSRVKKISHLPNTMTQEVCVG